MMLDDDAHSARRKRKTDQPGIAPQQSIEPTFHTVPRLARFLLQRRCELALFRNRVAGEIASHGDEAESGEDRQ